MQNFLRARGLLGAALLSACIAQPALAAQCGNSGGGFENWKQEFAQEARGRVGERGIDALMSTKYNTATISADRGQKSFHLSLDAFMAKRGANGIVARGRQLKQTHAALFNSIQSRFGVPPGPLLAIWGMETGFGAVHGNQHALSAVATLAYDCRRSDYFTDQLYSALHLIDRGALSPSARGSMHGEIGQTQFLPKNIQQYGMGGNLDNSAAALMATANFLHAHGWRAGAGYQPGEANFSAIQEWNAASVYEQAIAIIGKRIDGGDN